MDKFREDVVGLLKENILIRGFLALSLVLAIIYMYLTGIRVPGELLNITSVVLGFYFGGKTQEAIERMSKDG